MQKEILVIVAHPDDETIWVGGTILQNRNNKITIISLCRKNDEDRYPKFLKVCELLNAEAHIFDLDDSEEGDYKKITNKEIIDKIKTITKDKKYDELYTHGKNGEYGHIRHKEVHNAVNEMLKKKSLGVKKVFFFDYIKKDEICYNNSNADKLIRLNEFEYKMKKNLINRIYGFEKESFEFKCCKDAESFKIKPN